MNGDDRRIKRSSFMFDRRGAASLECALGMVVMVTAWSLGFDVYRQAESRETLLHTAAAFADYASRDEQVKATYIDAFAKFLRTDDLAPAGAVFVVMAITKRPSEEPDILWSRTVTIAPDTGGAPTPTECSQISGAGGRATLPTVFSMDDGEVVIAAEVCTTQDGDAIYAHHILPTRADNAPTLDTTPTLEGS